MDKSILSNSIENWLVSYKQAFKDAAAVPAGGIIEVSDAAGKLAFIYEKIRNTVDYREDHLLRRHATARILKRIMTPGSKGSEIARPLIEELIRARYLPNNKVPESAEAKVRHIINKYITVYNVVVDHSFPPKEIRSFFLWLLQVAACEIEESLVPAYHDKITIEAMQRVVRQNVILENVADLDHDSEQVQAHIAILKSLMKADEMTVNYYLLNYFFPAWQAMTLAEAAAIAINIKRAKDAIRAHCGHHLNERLTREFQRYAVVFWIMQDIINENPENYINLFKKPAILKEKIIAVCRQRYGTIGAKVRRAIIRSVIYIFCTKMIFGLLLELPYDYYILKHLQWMALGINALFPPLLMALIGASIRTPGALNTEGIIKNIDAIVYSDQGEEHRIKIRKKRKGLANFMMRFLYFITFLVSFGAVIYVLRRLHFSLASMIIFLFFLTMVSFFSLRIRRTAGELIVLKQRERLLTVVFSFLFLPILRVGRWISLHSSKINVFIFTLDFIIEAPFKSFIRIFEDLIIFIREKKDEMM